jgi:hypothetical protein
MTDPQRPGLNGLREVVRKFEVISRVGKSSLGFVDAHFDKERNELRGYTQTETVNPLETVISRALSVRQYTAQIQNLMARLLTARTTLLAIHAPNVANPL